MDSNVTPTSNRPKGLLMDWGGVMTTNVFNSFSTFCAAEGLDIAAVATVFRDNDSARRLLTEFECGRLSQEEFEKHFGALLGVDDHIGLVGRLFGEIKLEPTMLQFIRSVRGAGVRTGMLSNSWGGNTYDQSLIVELFEIQVISGDEGTRKPDPRIYEIAQERMRLPFEQLVFVDDLAGNLKPAAAAGMTVVHHTHPELTVAQITELLGL